MVIVLLGLCWTCSVWGCRRDDEPRKPEVVVYTALDRSFAEPILAEFERQTGIKPLAVYDTESTKTIGLVNRIRAERGRPRCDVFWNNEILNTLLLQREGLLRPTHPENAVLYAADVQDPAGMWHGFAARARVLIVNTDSVQEARIPTSMFDLIKPEWKDRVGLAKPVAGTTATHVACLFATLGSQKAERYFQGLKANGARIESGNKACAEDVGTGALAVAWTDTDDAVIERDAGKPVRIIFPDGGPDGLGTLLIPNTLAAIQNSPHPREAEKLINYLLSPAVERRLAEGESAQIPLNRTDTVGSRVRGPGVAAGMKVDFHAAAAQWEAAQAFVSKKLLTPGE